MSRLTRFHSFLDRFEEGLKVDCELLKQQLIAQVDHQFGALQTKVREMRSRFDVGNRLGTVNIDLWFDDPPVETVLLDELIQEQQHEASMNQPSTSTGRKRKLSPAQAKGGVKKRSVQASGNEANRKYVCQFVGCGKSFRTDILLARHERIHLGTKPFACTWPNCHKSFQERGNLVKHIRIVHFNLPASVKQQQELNIVNDRDPNEYIRVDTALLNRHQS